MPNLGIGISLGSSQKAGAAPFYPTSIAGLVWLLDPAFKTLNAGNVSSLPDQSGVGDGTNRDAIQNTANSQPLWNASDAAFNNQPTVGPFATVPATKYLQTAAWGASYAAPYTIFAAVKAADFANTQGLLGSVSGTSIDMYQYGNLGYLVSSGAHNIDPADNLATAACIVMLEVNGAATKAYFNSVTAHFTGLLDAVSFGATGKIVGNVQGVFASAAWLGHIAMLGAYNKILSGAEKTALITNYLGPKFGITTT